MQYIAKLFCCILVSLISFSIYADNQTLTVTPVIPSSNSLPFQIKIETASFALPQGFHSGVFGQYKQYWVFIAGSLAGLHGFSASNNFPPELQNRTIYVVNSQTGQTTGRSLTDPGSGLTQAEIDSLSVISPQGYQEDHNLIMSGGYGIDTATNLLTTKPILTVIYLPGIVEWVLNPGNTANTVKKNIRQLTHETFRIAGGEMFKVGNMTQLIFGQDFEGEYTDSSNGDYSNQIRRFIINAGSNLSVTFLSPTVPDPSYRRRDLNIFPTLFNVNNKLQYGLVAYAGVFTLSGGVWTVPVTIDTNGNPSMADPLADSTFKQAMNQYVCATTNFYSRKFNSMYNVFFGGMSYGYFDGDTFVTEVEVPFINQVTTVKMDQNGNFSQYLMNNEYPYIESTTANAGNQLLFGGGAYFIPNHVRMYGNGVISLDSIRVPTVIGHIVGGIASTLPNTNFPTDSFASPYIFTVTLIPS